MDFVSTNVAGVNNVDGTADVQSMAVKGAFSLDI